jgi:hypothetical protein
MEWEDSGNNHLGDVEKYTCSVRSLGEALGIDQRWRLVAYISTTINGQTFSRG